MPAGALRALLTELAGDDNARCGSQDIIEKHFPAPSEHMPHDFGSLLSMRSRAASFLTSNDGASFLTSNKKSPCTSFTESQSLSEQFHAKMAEQDKKDEDITHAMVQKVESALRDLEQRTKEKFDAIDQQLGSTYEPPPSKGGTHSDVPGATMHLPAMAPNQTAVVQLEFPKKSVGQDSDPQRDILNGYMQRLDSLMRTLAGEPSRHGRTCGCKVGQGQAKSSSPAKDGEGLSVEEWYAQQKQMNDASLDNA